jgi:hypothetical protein
MGRGLGGLSKWSTKKVTVRMGSYRKDALRCLRGKKINLG